MILLLVLLLSLDANSKLPLDLILENNLGLSLAREDLKHQNVLFVYASNLSHLKSYWYLTDLNSQYLRILWVTNKEVMKEYKGSITLYLDNGQIFNQSRRDLSYRFYHKSRGLETIQQGVPSLGQLHQWALKFIDIEKYMSIKIGNDGVIFQKDANDCGGAAVAMMLTRMQVPVTKSQVYEDLVHDQSKPMSLSEIKRFLSLKGIESEGWRGTLEHLKELRDPAILHLDNQHFVVLVKVFESGAVVLDPAVGRLYLSLEQLSHRWKGVYFRAHL